MLVRKCEPSIKRPDFDLHKLPVWVNLSHIPLELYYVARAIGVPLYMDTITAGQSRLVYAKVCVEIDANQIIPRTIDIILKDSSTRILWVEVPWIPQRCSKYSIFGHVDKACPKKLKEINKVQVSKLRVEIDEAKSESEVQYVILSNVSLVDGVFLNNGAHSESDFGVQAKGKHMLSSSSHSQVKGKGVLLGSTKRFALLEDNQLAQDFSEHELDEGEENSPRKSRAAASGVANLIEVLKQKRKKSIDIVCLLETRVKHSNAHGFLRTYGEAENGRIWIIWRNNVRLQLVAVTNQSITCSFQASSKQGYFTAIYGRNESRERCRLWEHLKDIQQGVGGNSWFLAGDFNVIADIKESLGSQCSSQLMRDIEEFLKCINGLELQDHSYFGPTYTWSNLQKESYLARELDSDD
ncbi:reverse transcriptase [Gossypium australe]|uniref:Reverse transcriptase n=1 Tax=Gossypium australe TaxID=47621 RepID=A0A5B6UPD4_9ROSI|nr:reverse transcriptase [Gossypium australe]